MTSVIRWKTAIGGRGEFEEVTLVHLDTLYRTALRLTRNRAEAEDIVRETYLRAFRSFHRFGTGGNARVWLFTILRNTFLNRLHDAGGKGPEAESVRLDPGAESATWERTEASPEEEFFQTLLHGDVERALNALPSAIREAVILSDLEGLSYKEAAEVLGCPTGTVMSRLSRGRALLRALLRRFAREHGYLKDRE